MAAAARRTATGAADAAGGTGDQGSAVEGLRGAAARCRGHASTLDGILDTIRPLSSEKFAGMAKPLARVLALLDILQTGGTRPLRGLSDRLGVDERTVRRYIGHLLDLDVPVESVRGRYGGYRLAPGYRTPPALLPAGAGGAA